MIDKKPYRVTNEEAGSWINQKLVLTGVNLVAQYLRVKINAFASDLLDARELIDKQEALIKEIREAIEFDRARFESFACSFQSHGIISEMERAKLCENDCMPILEKTKEYI